MARARARMETLKGHSSTPWQSTILHIGKHLQIYLFRIINLNILKQKSSDGGGDGGGGGETGGCDGGGGWMLGVGGALLSTFEPCIVTFTIPITP